MGNFGRVISLAFRHRFTVVAMLSCSLAVALLWGGNITAIYPVVDVIMNNKSIPQYLDEKRAEGERQIAELNDKIAAQKKKLEGEANAEPGRRVEIAGLENEQARLQRKVASYERWLPTARRWLPTTAFATLVMVCTGLVVGTLLKSGFR